MANQRVSHFSEDFSESNAYMEFRAREKLMAEKDDLHRRLLREAGKTADEREHETSEKRDRVERARAEEEEGKGQGDGTAGGDTEWAAVDDTEAVMA